MIGFIWFLFIVVCLLLTLIVLLQRGDAGGIGSAFGGGGGDTAFGVKADMTWKKATAYLAGTFFVLAIILGQLMVREQTRSIATGQAPAPQGEGAPAGQPAAMSPEAGGGGGGGAGGGEDHSGHDH